MPASRQEAYVSVMSGLGIALTSTAICNSELRSGRLLALLTDYAARFALDKPRSRSLKKVVEGLRGLGLSS
jgi:hypothetical protein